MMESSCGRDRIHSCIRENFGGTSFRLSELSERLQVANSKIAKLVSDMVREGMLEKVSRGVYRLCEKRSASKLFRAELATLPLEVNHAEKKIIIDISLFSAEDVRLEAARNIPSLLEKIERHKYEETDNDDLWDYLPVIEGLPLLDKEKMAGLLGCTLRLPASSILATSPIYSLPSPAAWKCSACGNVVHADIRLHEAGSRLRDFEPYICSDCGKKNCFSLCLEESGGVSYRNLSIEYGGEQFAALTGCAFDLQKSYDFSGVLRRRHIFRSREYEYFLEITGGTEYIDLPYDSVRAEEYLLSVDLGEVLQRSSIFQMSDFLVGAVLLACVEQANVLLYSEDPGTGKTDLSVFLAETVMQDCYVDSTNASAAGVTCGVDEKKMLSRGALLRSRYLCALDEIDKEKFHQHHSALLYVMQHRKIKMHKIVNCDLPVTCSMICGVNNLSVLPDPLLSRFNVRVRLQKTEIVGSPAAFPKPEEVEEFRNALLFLRFQPVEVPEEVEAKAVEYLNGLSVPIARSYDHLSIMLRGTAKLNRHPVATESDLKGACSMFENSFFSGLDYEEDYRQIAPRYRNLLAERQEERKRGEVIQ